MNKKLKCIGVAIPVALYELVKSVDPDRSFSDAVRCALFHKYFAPAGLGKKTDTGPVRSAGVTSQLVDIESIIDGWG